jgi:predicted transcriptional regulator
MISQNNSGEKATPSPKLENQTKLETLVNVLGLLSIRSPSTLNELAIKKRIPSKNMEIYLGTLLNHGLIHKTSQCKKLIDSFSLTQRGINVLRYFKPLEKKSQIEFMCEEKKWAISKLVKRN